MTLKFNPPKESGRYGLYVEGGRTMKLFDALSSAKLSYHFNNYGFPNAKILENVDGQWYVLHDIKDVHSYGDLPWVKEVQRGYYSSYAKYKKAVPMTREEYAEWRVAVERERFNNEVGMKVL
jgi:hypothetical protein